MAQSAVTNMEVGTPTGPVGAALVPDLFSRRAYVRCVRTVMRSLAQRSGEAVDDLDAASAALSERADCTGKVGVAGFGMGGGFALATHLAADQ